MASSDPSSKIGGAPRRATGATSATGATRPGVSISGDDDGADPSRSAPRRINASANSQPVPTQAADPDGGRSKKTNSGPTPIPTTLRQRRAR